MTKAEEAAGRMYHKNIKPMVKWLDIEWERLSDDHKSMCVGDAMDIVRIFALETDSAAAELAMIDAAGQI